MKTILFTPPPRNLTKFITIVMLVFIFGFESLAQTHVNREWIDNTGAPDTMIWSKSIAMPGDYLLHIGHTKVPTQPTNALFTYYDAQGNIEWQHTFVDSAQYDYYGVDADYDDNHDIYIVGTAKSNVDITAKIFLIKYDHSGNLIWQEFYHSHVSHEDIATAIYVDKNTGTPYVSVASNTPTSDFDYLALKFNTSGVLQWDARYDYNNLIDFPISVIQEDNKVFLTGASAMNPTRWQYTTVVFSEANGNFEADFRETVVGVGFDTPSSFIKDDDGYFYITGRTSTDGINYNVRTTKLDSSLNVQWTEIYDFAGQKDEGLSIDIDDNGNVYVGGYVTRAPNVTDLLLLKYDSNGNLVWEHTQASEDPTKEAKATVVQVTPDGYLYFAGYEHTKNGGNQRTIIGKYSPNNNTIYQRRTKSFLNGDEMPTGLRISEDKSIFLTTIQNDNQQLEYATRRYTEFTQDPTPYIVNDTAVFRAQEIIVRFKQIATIDSAFYPEYQGQRREFGLLDTYLYNFAMRSIDNKLKNHYDNWDQQTPNPAGMKAVKVFKELTPNFTKTVNRLGDTIRVPDFWTTLIVSFPPSLAIEDVYTAFNDLPGIIAYAEPNYFIDLLDDFINYHCDNDFTNDPELQYQNSIKSNGTLTHDDGSINICEAWFLSESCGKEHIKCGVFDTGVAFRHPDFGFESGLLNSNNTTKIRNGWDLFGDKSMFNSSPIDAHGTNVAGIIGAIRNNEIGISGIAGGDAIQSFPVGHPDYFSNKGASLFSLQIIGKDSLSFPDNPVHTTYRAIVESAVDSSELDMGYGLNLSNHSWGIRILPNNNYLHLWLTDTNYLLLRDAIHFSIRMQVTNVVARGNEGSNNLVYPAVIEDDWILCVGGTGDDGRYKDGFNNSNTPFSPSYGSGVDIAAPSTARGRQPHVAHFIRTTNIDNNNNFGYTGFGGTSAAAPHASGVVALMMSYLNDSIPAYHNMSPEDAERILELSAVNYDNPGQYDDYVGWGKLEASRAMRLIEKPRYTLHHFGTNHLFNYTKSISQESTNTSFYLKEQIQNYENIWFPKGEYLANVWKIEAIVNHNILSGDSIVAFWTRPSMSSVYGSIINDSLLAREKLFIDSIDLNSCRLYGYVYELFDTSGNPIGWIPNVSSLDSARLEYSVLSIDTLAPVAQIEVFSNESAVILYPNPTNQSHTIELSGLTGKEIKIDLYDMQGCRIRTVINQKIKETKFSENVDVSELPNGIYIYSIVLNDEHKSIKFVKE